VYLVALVVFTIMSHFTNNEQYVTVLIFLLFCSLLKKYNLFILVHVNSGPLDNIKVRVRVKVRVKVIPVRPLSEKGFIVGKVRIAIFLTKTYRFASECLY